MGRPLFKSDCDELEHFSRKRNAICSQRLLESLKANHGVASNDNQKAIEIEPDPLPEPSADPLVLVSLNKIDLIKRVVCKHFGVSKASIESTSRKHGIVGPRQIVMYLARQHTTHSYPEIGRRLGGRDHTTILHAFHKIGSLRMKNPQMAADLARLEAFIL